MKKRDVVVTGADNGASTLPQMSFIMTALAIAQWTSYVNI